MINLRGFDSNNFLENAKTVYGLRTEVEKLADELSKKKYKNIIMIGQGGTVFTWTPIAIYLRHLADIPVYVETAAEMVLKKDMPYLSADSLILTNSVSGDTTEILDAVRYCNKKGYKVYGLTGKADSPLAQMLEKPIYHPVGGTDGSYLLYYFLTLKIYHNWGFFDDYDRWADQMVNIGKNLLKFREDFDPRAKSIAEKYYNEPLTMLVASGMTWAATELFSMCILEEMQWVRTRPIRSSDFFHGPLEIVDNTLPVFVIKGEDEYRPLDERVERFVKQYTNKVEVIDTKDFVFDGIDDEYRVMLTPMIFSSILDDRLAYWYHMYRGHDLDFRRYYRQFDY
ncbi:SIS domain-containing protein [Pediococcus parvulus]|uniref:SIS domain-containing protein n=1 Tax=Pediococcus parvulus TaxID=54062 RepID=UPI0037576590